MQLPNSQLLNNPPSSLLASSQADSGPLARYSKRTLTIFKQIADFSPDFHPNTILDASLPKLKITNNEGEWILESWLHSKGKRRSKIELFKPFVVKVIDGTLSC